VNSLFKKQRALLFDKFRASNNSNDATEQQQQKPIAETKKKTKPVDPYANTIMFATDVMARGVDIPNIDWVVQFDPPRQSAYVFN
jgi:hypothetical protein